MKFRIISLLTVFVSLNSSAENLRLDNLTIDFIRAVGNYQGTTFDNTIELHFTSELSWPVQSACQNKTKVTIDAEDSHLISAAYAAYMSGASVNVNVDTALPVRNGSCQISYLDIIKR